jgi:hypothetical protein
LRIIYRYLFYQVVLGLLAICFQGCGKPSAPTPESPTTSTRTKPIFSIVPKIISDESLTPEEYIRLGLPAHDRDWSGDDMVKAEQVLSSISKEGYRKLPRHQSERSGEVFARLTSAENLDLYRNRSLPLEVRMPQAMNYFQASNQINKIYLSAFLKREVRDTELLELMGAMLRSSVAMLEIVDEFLPTINKDDPNYQVRMQGLEKMKRGLADVVVGCLQTLTERESYRGSELAKLVGYMQDTVPVLVLSLPPGSRIEITSRLEKMQNDPVMKYLQPGLQNLHLKVKAELEKKPAEAQ